VKFFKELFEIVIEFAAALFEIPFIVPVPDANIPFKVLFEIEIVEPVPPLFNIPTTLVAPDP